MVKRRQGRSTDGASGVRYELRLITKEWKVPLGVMRLRYLRAKGGDSSQIAAIAGAPIEQVEEALDLVSGSSCTIPAASSTTVANLKSILGPAIEPWAQNVPSDTIAANLGMTRAGMLAKISLYRRYVSSQDFPYRRGTPNQIKPRLHGEACTDAQRRRDIGLVRAWSSRGIPDDEIAQRIPIGIEAVRKERRRWKAIKAGRGAVADLAFMASHESSLEVAIRLWSYGANHQEIARHYGTSAPAMWGVIQEARRKSANRWFGPRDESESRVY